MITVLANVYMFVCLYDRANKKKEKERKVKESETLLPVGTENNELSII